eukprot:scaffold112554_cov32-Prasinocladus_malaysianus.AAC.1
MNTKIVRSGHIRSRIAPNSSVPEADRTPFVAIMPGTVGAARTRAYRAASRSAGSESQVRP